MGSKACGFERSVKFVRSVMGGALASVLALFAFVMCAPQLAFADEAFQTIDGTMTITLQGGASGGGAGGGTGAPTVVTTSATTSGGASSSVLTGDALIWLILGIVVLLAGAVYVIVKSRKLASAGTIASATTGTSDGSMTNTTAGSSAGSSSENLTSAKRKTIIVAVITALVACACFGMFASKSSAFAKEYLEGITGTSNVVVDEQGNVISNDLAINNGSGVAIYINNIQAPDELNGWNASIKDETVQSGSSAKGAWDGKTIPASVLEQVKNNSNTSIELALKVSINKAFDFDKFSVDTDSATYDGNQIKPEVTSDAYKQGADYEVIYGENKNVGEGTVTIKGINDYKGEKTYTFTIAPKEVTLIWGDQTSYEYDGQSHVPSVSLDGVVKGDTVEVIVDGAQTNAGTYTATATIDSTNYKLSSDAKTTQNFTITQREVSLAWSSDTLIYNGQAQIPKASVSNAVSGDTVDVTVVTPSGKDAIKAGSYNAIPQALNNANYKLPQQIQYQPFTIEKAPLIITGLEAVSKTYNGTTTAELSGEAKVEGIAGADDVSVTPSATFSDPSAGKDKEVTIAYALNGEDASNYVVDTNKSTTKLKATIDPATLDFKQFKIATDGAKYTGEQIKPAVTSDDYTEYVDYEVVYGKNVNAGEGSVTIKGMGNYTGADTTTFTIAKAKPEPAIPGLTAETGQTLADVALSKQTEPVAGTFAWKYPSTQLAKEGTFDYDAIFTPKDTTNYEVVEVVIPVTVTSEKTAFAVYFDNGTLGFYNRVTVPAEGEFDSKNISEVYTGIENADYEPGWLDKEITRVTVVDAGIQPKSTANWFALTTNASKLTTIDASKLETINTTNMSSMFKGCTSLTTLGDISSWNTSQVTNMASMFEGCAALEQAGDISGWNTASATNMTSMFKDCAKLKENCMKWEVTKVGNNHTDFDTGAPGIQSPWDIELNFDNFTVDTEAKTYSKEQITPEVKSDTYALNTDYEVIYGANLKAGKGTITIKGLNDHKGEKTYTFAIKQKELGLTWNETSFTYDGNSHLPTITLDGIIDGDTVGSIVKGKHTDAGTYSVIAYIDDTNYTLPANYKTMFTIEKAEVTVSGITAKDKAYDGTTKVELNFDAVAFDKKFDKDDLSITAEGTFENINAGANKTVAISNLVLVGASVKNYKLADQGQQTSATATITQRIAEIEWSRTSLTYTGSPRLPKASVKNVIQGDKVEVSVATKDRTEAIKAGTYEAEPTGLSDPNYTLPQDMQAQPFTIERARILVKDIVIAADKYYDGTNDAQIDLSQAEISGILGTDEVKVEAKGAFEDPSIGEDKTVIITYVLSGKDAENYEVDTEYSRGVTTANINRAPINTNKICISSEGTSYTGNQVTPEVTIEGLTQDTDFIVAYGENIYAGENAGSVIVVGINNYFGQGTKTFNIAKGTPDYIIPQNITAEVGHNLYQVTLPEQTTPVKGTFVWNDPSVNVGGEGSHTFSARFVPEDTQNYSEVADIEIPVEVFKEKTVFAVYFTNGTLGFYNRDKAPSENETFDDKTVDKVYSDITTTSYKDSLAPWHDKAIKKAIVVDYGVQPASTAKWFNLDDQTKLTEIDVSKLSISKVTDMSSMFSGCKELTTLTGVSDWDTSNVTDMTNMFNGCSKLELDCSDWNVDKVGQAHQGFNSDAPNIVSPWDTKQAFAVFFAEDNSLNFYKRVKAPEAGDTFDGKKVTAVYLDIEDATYESTTRPWNDNVAWIEKVVVVDKGIAPISTAYWFADLEAMESADVSRLDTSKVTDMSNMFADSSKIETLNLSNFGTSNVTTMEAMFQNCSNLTSIDGLLNWDTSNVVNMVSMFESCTDLQSVTVSNFNTSKVETMQGMFHSCENLTSIAVSNFDTSKVVTMRNMFAGCSKLTRLEVSNWDVSQVKTLEQTFQGCSALVEVTGISSWNTDTVTDMSSTFLNCSSLTADCSDWSIKNVPNNKHSNFNENAPGVISPWAANTAFAVLSYAGYDSGLYFYKDKTVPKKGDTYRGKTVTEVYTDLEDKFYDLDTVPWYEYKNRGTEPDKLSIRKIEVVDYGIAPVSIANWFYDCYYVKSVNLAKLDTSRIKDMTSAFYGCGHLESIDVSAWDSGNLTNMSHMFDQCIKLKSVNLFKTSQVTDMSYLFNGCGDLAQPNVSNIDTSKVENMRYMFCDCASLVNLDLSQWNTSQVTDMRAMFNYCRSLETLNVSQWDTSRVTDMSEMFYQCKMIYEFNIEVFDTSRVTDMNNMFVGVGCGRLFENRGKLRIEHWDVSQVINMDEMLFDIDMDYGMDESLDLGDWDVSNVKSHELFTDCPFVIVPEWKS